MAEVPLTITDAAAALRAGELTSVELTAACFAVADRLDPTLGTYIVRYDESALAAAATADAELASGLDRGPLHGIPLGIKDIIATAEGPTTGNSVVNDPQWFLGEDAPVVGRLRAAGAVITGKLTTMEYACGLPDASKPFPVPRNPWDVDTWPGGSSSGSGSGVAAGMFLGALGTVTGGSVRMPAAFCGISATTTSRSRPWPRRCPPDASFVRPLPTADRDRRPASPPHDQTRREALMAEVPLTITDAAAALRAGELTSVELTQKLYEVADRLDPQLGTYITRYDETALAAAAAADAELAAGVDKGPLHGIPLGIKDIIACQEGPTTGNSVVNDPQWFLGQDAPVVARLRAAGAIITGKLTTMEYAIGLPDATKPFPIPRNPWNPDTWPGGSSSGSGAGVAAGMFLGALGTDTGGSVRMPAAFCGITGMKQTYGLVPKAGCLPLGVTLDHIGPMTRSAADAAAMLEVMAGYDPSDPSMLPGVAAGDYTSGLTGDLTGLTIGVVRESHLDSPACDPALEGVYEAAVATLAQAGATVVEVVLPYFDEMTTATLYTMCVEAFSFHQANMAIRWTDYGLGMRSFVASGALCTAPDYAQMQKVRRVGRDLLVELFTTVDLIVTPTSLAGAPVLEGIGVEHFIDIIKTPYWNAVGNPTMAIPMGFTEGGLPLSLQIAGRPYEDGLVFKAGDAFQRLTDFHLAEAPLAASALA